jgi:serine/threonine protein kinase
MQGVNSETNQEVAIKLERCSHEIILEWEVYLYKSLSGGAGIPLMHWSGHQHQYNIMVLDLLGPTLEDLLNYCNYKFSLKTVLMLFDQLIYRLEYIHSKKIIHGDIKTENLMMGVGRRGNTVYVADFGLARIYFDDREQPSRPRVRKVMGTACFASINGHYGLGKTSPFVG